MPTPLFLRRIAVPALLSAVAFAAAGSASAAPVINEIMYRPGTGYPEDTSLEFIEIHNPDATAVDLSGWALRTGVDYVLPSGTTLAAGGYLVVAANPTALVAAHSGLSSSLVVGPWETGDKLSNNGEDVTLSSPDGAGGFDRVDRVTYADEGDWATRTRDSLGGWSWITQSNGGGCSLERRNPLLAVDSGQNWGASTAVGGTPGAANTLRVSNVAPLISSVKHSPAVPKSTEVVTISCQLADESAVSSLSATLWWRDATSTSPGAFQSVAMTNEGTGRFSATLAAKTALAIVEFYVSASDGSLTRTWPAPNSEGQTTNCAYQVDNEVITGTAPAYRLILTAAENAAFTSASTSSDRTFALTLVATHGDDTTIRYRSEMRMRGNSSRNYTIKPLRVNMPHDDRWDGVSSFLIGPRGAPLQFLAHKLQRAAGLVAADAMPIEVRRQGVEYAVTSGSTADYGRLCRVEDFNSDYASNHFPEAVSAQIYRKISITNWSSLYTAPTTPDGTYSGWDKQTDSAANDWSDVVNFTTVWQNLSASHFTGATAGNVASGTWNGVAFTDAELATLSTVVDLDYLARWLAVMTIMPNAEENISNGEDDDYAAVFVNNGTNTRMYLVPHDMDTTFGSGESTKAYNFITLYDASEAGSAGMTGAVAMEPLQPLLGTTSQAGNAAFRAKYLTAIRELFGSFCDADTSSNSYPPFYQFVDNHLADWMPATNSTALAARTAIKTFMTNRQAYLLGLIGSAKITPTAATTGAGTLTSAPSGTVRLNEILALNTSAYAVSSAYPDLVELYNSGATAVSLAGYTLYDGEAHTYTFPSGTTLAAGAYLLLTSDTLGFALDTDGDTVTLADASAAVLDTVTFGPQLADKSISRLSTSANTWGLTTPTPAAANGAALTLGTSTTYASALRLNEWAGNIDFRLTADFVEIYNPSAVIVPLGGLVITDNIATYPTRYTFPALSYIAASGFTAVESDLLGFGLNAYSDDLWLVGANAAVIDRADISAQFADYSTGRATDGGTTWANFALPTPGLSNATAAPTAYTNLRDYLRITEVMYAPTGGGDYEYVELQNISSTVTLDLSGVRFTSGIDYTFASGATLAPGAYVVVCKKRSTYLARYTSTAAVNALAAGSFSGALDNSGEEIALTLPFPYLINVLRFTYSPDWYPTTASASTGYSLTIRDAVTTAARSWGDSVNWAPSAVQYGSPGAGDPPSITSALAATGIVGDAFSYKIVATKSPTSYSAAGLPAGLLIDTATGLISGTPTAAGTSSVTIGAANATASSTATLTLTVAAHGSLDHFTWEYLPASAYAGKNFPVLVSARDAGGRLVQTFAGTSAISAARVNSAVSPVLITELTDEGEDQFELQNVSSSTVNTTGWFAIIGDSTTTVASRNTATYSLPASMASGALLRVSESASTGRVYFGNAIAWTNTTPRGWVMLFDSTNTLRDFVAFGWTATELASLSLTVNSTTVAPLSLGQWSGAGLVAGTRGTVANTPDSWRRTGASDGNTSANWTWSYNAASFGTANTGLTLPFATSVALTTTPTTASFAAGEFLGYLAVATAADDAILTSTYATTYVGNSAAIDILSATDTDADGIPDAWETAHGLTVGSSTNDATLDSDGDGQSNQAEFLAGTDPQSSASVFAITTTALSTASGSPALTVAWSGVAGHYYEVRTSPDLVTWTTATYVLATADGAKSVELPTAGAERFFARVVLVP